MFIVLKYSTDQTFGHTFPLNSHSHLNGTVSNTALNIKSTSNFGQTKCSFYEINTYINKIKPTHDM